MHFLSPPKLLDMQLQTLQMLWLDKKRVGVMVYHRLRSSFALISLLLLFYKTLHFYTRTKKEETIKVFYG